MRAKSLLSLCVSLAMLFPTIASAAEASQKSGGLSGTVTPKLTMFDYTGGGDFTRAHFLQRYDYQKSWFGDNISGAYMDLDLDLAYSNGAGTSLSVERRGDGLTNQAGLARFDTDKVGIAGYYNHHRTVAVGIDYITRPNNAPGGTDAAYTVAADGYVARFNDDTNGSFFRIDRTNYGAGVKLKPALLGDMASLSFNHDGYRRVGNTYATWVAGGSDFGGTAATVPLQRWRGYDKPVNETMDRGSIGLVFSPKDLFQLAYDGSFEKFVSRAENRTISYAASMPGVVAAGNTVSAANGLKPLHFIPDSTQTSHAVRLSKTFAKAALAAGYGLSVLRQDSFTYKQTSVYYNEGKIASQNLFVNGKVRVVPSVEAEAYLKYGNRRNDSTFPAVGLLDAAVLEQLDMRLNTLKTVEYGVAATLRPSGSKSSLVAGWKRLAKKRGFTLNRSAAGAKSERMLYETDSNTNEAYLKGTAHPADGVTVRLTPSYEWADKVGSPVDARKAVNLKADASYATTEGSLLSVYYGYKDKRNAALDYANGTTTAQTFNVGQSLRSVLHSAGASLSAALSPKVNSTVSADWSQSDFQTDYITSNRRRYEAAAIVFTPLERTNTLVDTYSVALASDWQTTEALKLSGGYSLSRSKGHVAGFSELSTTVDGGIDNVLHSASVGAEYALTKALNLGAQYVFDHYKDKQYAALSGSGHTITTALAYRF